MQRYKRVLLKLSGESLGKEGAGIDPESVKKVAETIANLKRKYDIALAIVVGGGNIFRGKKVSGTNINRASADYAGMSATIPNGLILQAYLEDLGVVTRVMSYLNMNQAYEPYIHRIAQSHLAAGKVVILVGGLGMPNFSTDTAAAQFAVEFECDVLLKGSQVDGIYNKDPKKYPDAIKYEKLSFQAAVADDLITVMDDTAFAHCKTNKIPIVVFNIDDLENIERIVRGEIIGTLVS